MDIKQIRNFVSVADQKSFSKAAASLNLSQPALSLSIRNLEQELDSKLLLRTRKEVTVTDLGAKFLIHARAVLREIEKAEEVFITSASEKSHTINVGLTSLFSNFMANPVFSQFCRDNPSVKVEIEVTAHGFDVAVDRVSSGLWDFGIVLRPNELFVPKDIVAERCLDLSSCVHASLNHPLAQQDSLTIQDLVAYPWVMSTHTDGRAIMSRFKELGLTAPTIASRVNSFNFIVALVSDSDFITILPREIVKAYHNDSLTKLDIDGFNFKAAVDIIYSKDLELTRPSRQLKKQIESFVRSFA